ncbi:zinc c2h2 type domain-containing protein-5 [Lasius niger]|uniref:Zinc c2h2 type domain-containing protein-5 n=1 Tax=Lasius niger TaxID=67767 RepID=A0A0J7JWR2_LASNI|nr:zinc c2h2 type domain-containing protein-5 [Lasius niger]
MQAFLQQDPNHPGLETVRLPCVPDETNVAPQPHCREAEIELCLVCRRCGRAYPQESTLLAHQRSCYLGNQQRRGALRLVQMRYACSLCEPGIPTRTYTTANDWRRHAETLQHRTRLEAAQQQQQQHQHQHQHQQQQQFDGGAQSGEETNPLTDEMEDVVNQITLLAARAAAESTTSGQSQTGERAGGQDNNNGPDAKRQKLVQEVTALAGAR